MASSSSNTAATSLHIPPSSYSSSSATSRPVSAAVHQNPVPINAPTATRRQQRASHSVTSPSQQAEDSNSPYPDVYSHPAVVAYTAAHPRRTIPRFGPYLLLQTLGEGEFGKVKLGIHVQWGEEVAVKLIRRGNVDNAVRLSKVEREIEVLKALKHPNIVRLYDVIETDKYIGIIIEFASGGELFDHILAHRYLKERDAAKLFSQLISGVWYIHQKKIVHRDLKLENLLLDRHRNVIITDFGFANRFEHKADDLMQTSCGSPCYAAPELVISEGLYVGSAVDIWSCGVILYAMLAGYLPFDDDPANPDGDNINLLYKYIVSTPLSFPDYISAEARDLLSIMLVPDPTRRANLDSIMRHRWLSAHFGAPRTDGIPNAFGRTVDELERAALDLHQQRRLAYQRQMRTAAANQIPRAAHTREATHTGATTSRSRSTQPEMLYESPADQSMVQTVSSPIPAKTGILFTPSSSARKPTYGSPTAHGITSDDPFAPVGQSLTSAGVATSRISEEQPTSLSNAGNSTVEPKAQSPKGHKANNSSGSGFRHTIQVEYDEPKSGRASEERRGGRQSIEQNTQQFNRTPNVPTKPSTGDRKPSTGQKPLPVAPATQDESPKSTRGLVTPKTQTSTPSRNTYQSIPSQSQKEIPTLSVSTPPATPDTTSQSIRSGTKERDKETGSQTSRTSSTRKSGHKKEKSSLDKFGFAKIFGGGNASASGTIASPVVDSLTSPVAITSRIPSEASSMLTSHSPEGKEKEKDEKEKSGKKSRRNTLTVMVEPISRTIRGRGKKSSTTPSGEPSNVSSASLAPPLPSNASATSNNKATQSAITPGSTNTAESFGMHEGEGDREGNGMSASSSKARNVMAWFRTKSKGRDSPGVQGGGADDEATFINTAGVELTVTTPTATTTRFPNPISQTPIAAPGLGKRSASATTDASAHTFSTPNFVQRFRNSVTVGGSNKSHHQQAQAQQQQLVAQHPHGQLRIHHGAVDQTTITQRNPPEVMKHVKEVLEGMGMEITLESEYKYRCVRVKKKKGVVGVHATQIGGTGANGKDGKDGKDGDVALFNMIGSAGSSGVDRRGLPLPSQSSFGSTGNMLRGLLMRRQSSQVSTHSSNPSPSHPHPPLPNQQSTINTNPNSLAFDDESSVVISPTTPLSENPLNTIVLRENATAYGDPTQDAGDEVRFSVELTRISGLNDTFSLDIRRLKGNLRSYKFLYDTIRQRADLQSLGH